MSFGCIFPKQFVNGFSDDYRFPIAIDVDNDYGFCWCLQVDGYSILAV